MFVVETSEQCIAIYMIQIDLTSDLFTAKVSPEKDESLVQENYPPDPSFVPFLSHCL